MKTTDLQKKFSTWLVASAMLLWSTMVPVIADAQIAVVGNTVEERVSAPGETYQGTIVVRNLTTQDQPVRGMTVDCARAAPRDRTRAGAGFTHEFG